MTVETLKFKTSESKVEFFSETTERYFGSGWDELELDANPEIKDKIRENILIAEKRDIYSEWATEEGLSRDELKERLQNIVEDLIDKASFFRATNLAVVEDIMLVDGRWKTQFETGTTSAASLGAHWRAHVEETAFGFPKDGSPVMRPVYGFFTDGENGEQNLSGKVPPPSTVSQYGPVNFKIKKDRALKKATVTFQDSLGSFVEFPATPAAKPHFVSLRAFGDLKLIHSTKHKNWGAWYTEAQYHGGLTMEDVESIHISEKNGMTPEDMQKVRDIYAKYMELHPESDIKLVEY